MATSRGPLKYLTGRHKKPPPPSFPSLDTRKPSANWETQTLPGALPSRGAHRGGSIGSRAQGCGQGGNRCAAGSAHSQQVNHPKRGLGSRESRSAGHDPSRGRPDGIVPWRAPSHWPSHLVLAPRTGAHLGQLTSGEGGGEPLPTAHPHQAQPLAPTLVYLGGSIPRGAKGVE